MHPVAVIFVIACIGSLAVTASEDCCTRFMSIMMAILCASANVLWLYDRMDMLPFFDLPIAMVAYALLCVYQTKKWFIVSVVFAFRVTLHVPGQWGMIPVSLYLHWINAAFLVALLAISWEGGQRAFVGTFSRFSDMVRLVRRVPQGHSMVAEKR